MKGIQVEFLFRSETLDLQTLNWVRFLLSKVFESEGFLYQHNKFSFRVFKDFLYWKNRVTWNSGVGYVPMITPLPPDPDLGLWTPGPSYFLGVPVQSTRPTPWSMWEKGRSGKSSFWSPGRSLKDFPYSGRQGNLPLCFHTPSLSTLI